MNSGHKAAEMQPVEGAQNLGFAKFKAARPESSGGEDPSWTLAAVGPRCWPAAESGQVSSGRCVLQAKTPQQRPTMLQTV